MVDLSKAQCDLKKLPHRVQPDGIFRTVIAKVGSQIVHLLLPRALRSLLNLPSPY